MSSGHPRAEGAIFDDLGLVVAIGKVHPAGGHDGRVRISLSGCWGVVEARED